MPIARETVLISQPEPVPAACPGRMEGPIGVAVIAAILAAAAAGGPAGDDAAFHGDPGSDWRDGLERCHTRLGSVHPSDRMVGASR